MYITCNKHVKIYEAEYFFKQNSEIHYFNNIICISVEYIDIIAKLQTVRSKMF